VHALCLNKVFDHPKERFQRLRSGIDEADPENIEAPGPRNMSICVGLWSAHVHDKELRIGEAALQLVHGPQQGRIHILHLRSPWPSSKLISSVITATV